MTTTPVIPIKKDGEEIRETEEEDEKDMVLSHPLTDSNY